MIEKQKKFYVAPLLEVDWLEMEEGIAVASATINVNAGSEPQASTPTMTDWSIKDVGGSTVVDF